MIYDTPFHLTSFCVLVLLFDTLRKPALKIEHIFCIRFVSLHLLYVKFNIILVILEHE